MKKLLILAIALSGSICSAQTIDYQPTRQVLAVTEDGGVTFAPLTSASGIGSYPATPPYFQPMCSATGAPPFSQCDFSGGGGGGATFTPPGLQFATSTTAARVALPADIANLITPQTGCSTAGFVWVPASNTCVAQSGGSSAFSAITSGTNTTAAMSVGTGASLAVTGTGTIGATSINGVSITGTPTAGQIPTATGSAAATWQTPSSGFTPNQNITYLSTNCGAAANCITVHGDVRIDNSASWTSGSHTVNTSSTAMPFLSTDCTGGSGCTGTANKKVFGTGNCIDVNLACDTQIAAGTIATFVNAHQVTVSSTTTAACTVSAGSSCNFLWGTDDTANLQAGMTAVLTSNAQLQLPCANMFFDAPVFVTTTSTPHQYPLGIRGDCAFGSTLLIPTPDFAFGGGTNVLLNDQLPFSSIGNDYFENFSVYGAGEVFATPPVANTTVMTFQNAYVKNVAILGVNWSQPVSGYISMGNTSLSGVVSVGSGTTACVFSLNVTTLSNGSLCDETNSMQVNNGAVVVSHGTTWSGFLTVGGSGAFFDSFGDIGNVAADIFMSGSGDTLVVDGWVSQNSFAGRITLQNNSTANISNSALLSDIVVGGTSIASVNNSNITSMQMTGGTAKVSNTIFNNSGASAPAAALAMPSGSPIFLDGGGNTFTSAFASTVTNTSGSINSQNMLQGTCTGTAISSSTLFLYGLGAIDSTTCATTVQQGGRVMNKAGTLTNLTCTAGTAGLTSDTCTVVKNGTPVALTCTFASATCQDTTTAHYVTYVPNDIIAIQVTSGSADTLANVGAQVWAQ
jgi:hypothetical protein